MMQPWFRECFELDDRYMVVLLVLCSVNKLFTLLYSCGAWLRRHEAAEVSSLGFTVLRGIRKLADMSLLRGGAALPAAFQEPMLCGILLRGWLLDLRGALTG